MKSIVFFVCVLFVLLMHCLSQKDKLDSITWHINNLENIGGNKLTLLGSPMIIDTPFGQATQFDGIDDGIILNTNPLADVELFTVEVIFYPDSGGNPEQRFIHMGEIDGNRVLIETRLIDNNKWFLDTYIKSGESELTLYAKNFPHSTGRWYHAALVYDGKNMRHYVNGSKELEEPIEFSAMVGGKTSVGCRLNKIFWYKGSISKIKITPRVLSPEEFLSLEYN